MKQEHNSSSHYQLDASIGVKQIKSKLDFFHDKLHLTKKGQGVLKGNFKRLKDKSKAFIINSCNLLFAVFTL